MSNFIHRHPHDRGVLVLAVGAFSGDYYVALNGVILYKGDDLDRAEFLFVTFKEAL